MESKPAGYRVKATIGPGGTLTLEGLPYQTGEIVEVTLQVRRPDASADSLPLRGLPVRLERPTDPVAEADWEALS